MSFDSCGARAHVCGGAQKQQQKKADTATALRPPSKQPRLGLKTAPATSDDALPPPPKVAPAEARSLQQTIDCAADPDNLYCCEMIEDAPCLMKNIVKDSDGCSTACQRRYQTIPYQCYQDFRTHFIFKQMIENCDPTGAFKWQAPTTTLAPRTMGRETASAHLIGVAGAPHGAVPPSPLQALVLATLAAAAAAGTLGTASAEGWRL